MKIETARPDDLPELLELYKELVDYENSLLTTLRVFQKMIHDKNYHLLVAKDGDKIVGSVLGIICYSIPIMGMPFMVIEDVIVKSDYRHQGIGKMLFDELDRIAKASNCCYSFLVSSEKRKEAHVFYEKQGYNDPAKGFRKKYNK